MGFGLFLALGGDDRFVRAHWCLGVGPQLDLGSERTSLNQSRRSAGRTHDNAPVRTHRQDTEHLVARFDKLPMPCDNCAGKVGRLFLSFQRQFLGGWFF